MKSINVDSEVQMAHSIAESRMGFRGIINELPYLHFREHWQVKLMYPFGGATARFLVRQASNPQREVSVYLDCHSALGFMDEAYWEIYPNAEGETERFIMGTDEAEMLAAIQRSLDSEA